MGFHNFYHSWYPGVNVSGTAENSFSDIDTPPIIPITSSPSLTTGCSPKLRCNKWVGWTVIVALVLILLIVIASNLWATSSSSTKSTHLIPSANLYELENFSQPDDPLLKEAEILCPLGHFKCRSTGNCIPLGAYCNGEFDCGSDDFTDEPLDESECSCRHYLELVAPERVCDPQGICHCPDKSDCLKCPCSEYSFHCDDVTGRNTSTDCIPNSLVCDGSVNCINSGRDEENCITLSTNPNFLDYNIISNNTTEGYVLVQVRGVWWPYCSNDWSKDVFQTICKHLKFRAFVDGRIVEMGEFYSEKSPELTKFEEDEENGFQLLVVRDYRDMTESHLNIVWSNRNDESHETEWSSCKLGYLTCANYD